MRLHRQVCRLRQQRTDWTWRTWRVNPNLVLRLFHKRVFQLAHINDRSLGVKPTRRVSSCVRPTTRRADLTVRSPAGTLPDMPNEDTTSSVLLNGVPLKRMPRWIREFFAEVRRKRRQEVAHARQLEAKKRRAVARLKRLAEPGTLLRLLPDGTLLRRCISCWEEKPIEQFAWKGNDFRCHCRRCHHRIREYVRAKYPWKEQARRATRRAVEKGLLEKTPCASCGEPDVQAHHEVYNKTGTKVRWLCRECHDVEHRRLGKRSSGRRVYRLPTEVADGSGEAQAGAIPRRQTRHSPCLRRRKPRVVLTCRRRAAVPAVRTETAKPVQQVVIAGG